MGYINVFPPQSNRTGILSPEVPTLAVLRNVVLSVLSFGELPCVRRSGGSSHPHVSVFFPGRLGQLGGGGEAKSWGPLDSVYFPTYPKTFSPAASQKSIEMFGDPSPPPPPQEKKTLPHVGNILKKMVLKQ